MPGKTCVDFENGIYHVYNRGVNKQNIFCDDQDRWYFIKLCKKAHVKYETEFLAFCLMGNHYHLFIRTPQANLSKVMKYIDERFSKYYIRKYKSSKKSGHTFMGPYGRRIVQTDLYASTLLAYIHNNPVKDGFVKHPADYTWSSYNYYESNFDQFSFINKDLLANKFISSPKDQKGKAMVDPELLNWEPNDHTLMSLFLGDTEFAKNIFENHLQDRSCLTRSPFFSQSKQQINSHTMRNIVNSIKINPLICRNILIYSLLEWTEVQAPELEQEFGVKAASLRKIKFRVNKRINANNQAYVKIVSIIKNKCKLC